MKLAFSIFTILCLSSAVLADNCELPPIKVLLNGKLCLVGEDPACSPMPEFLKKFQSEASAGCKEHGFSQCAEAILCVFSGEKSLQCKIACESEGTEM
jgi:hypothetical protein